MEAVGPAPQDEQPGRLPGHAEAAGGWDGTAWSQPENVSGALLP